MPLSSGCDGHFLVANHSLCLLVFLRHLRLFWYLVGSKHRDGQIIYPGSFCLPGNYICEWKALDNPQVVRFNWPIFMLIVVSELGCSLAKGPRGTLNQAWAWTSLKNVRWLVNPEIAPLSFSGYQTDPLRVKASEQHPLSDNQGPATLRYPKPLLTASYLMLAGLSDFASSLLASF
ncbi:hypothetical protein BJX65DRAFT_121814 [Aspergillus insuetus]